MQPEKIGRYEIKSELGRGGMATVYRGYDPRFEREVAVKVLPPELLHADPQFRLRFAREAKIIASLEHSSIVPVYDVGADEDLPYFVMRYMTGGSLSERIKAGILSVEEATRIIEKVGPGLDEAHAKGIVHRDIKPSNILFDNKGIPYISDFGIAKLSQAQAGSVTGSGIIGTPAYMAPEQAQGDSIDGRADIYALGIILFEMVTGRQPYEADTPMAVAIKHITDPIPLILNANPKLPPGMDMIIQRAMAKDRDDRFSSSKEMLDALHAVMRGDTTKLQPVAPKTIKGTLIQKPVAEKKGFNVLAVVIPIVALAAIAGGFFLFNGINRPSATEAPPANTSTSAPSTETPEPIAEATEAAILPAETTTEAPPTATETVAPLPAFGGADRMAFVANNDIWIMNMDGSDIEQLTNDGGTKTDLQWLSDGKTLVFISGKTIKYYDISTGVVDTLATFPSEVSVDSFRVSHDGTQVMLAMSNNIFVIPFDLETLKTFTNRNQIIRMEETCILPTDGTRAALKVKETRWSADDKLVAWLFKGVDAGNSSLQAEQVSVLDISTCAPERIDQHDNFPATRFMPVGYQDRTIPDIDWDGNNLFVFNTNRRNNGWGELYVYDWVKHKAYHITPLNSGACCYRDARWSPDGTYLFFAFQDFGLGAEAPTLFYYVPYGDIGTGSTLTPLSFELPEGFKNPKEAPQPALHAAP